MPDILPYPTPQAMLPESITHYLNTLSDLGLSNDVRSLDAPDRIKSRVRFLIDWNQPDDLVWAAAIPSTREALPLLPKSITAQAIRYAQQCAQEGLWLDLRNVPGKADISHRQSKLFRTLYVDRALALLTLADHLALVMLRDVFRFPIQQYLAEESLEIFIALLKRFGARDWRCALYDCSLVKALPKAELDRYSDQYDLFTGPDSAFSSVREEVVTVLSQHMAKARIPARIAPRHFHFHEFYSRIVQGLSPAEAVRYEIMITPENEMACYQSLSAFHQLGKCRQVQDYLACPGEHGYQALTSTIDYMREGTEERYQIKAHITPAHLEEFNRKGYFSEHTDIPPVWWRNRERLAEWRTMLVEPETVPQIAVFSPDAAIFTMSAGATALDFAYAIHSDVGNQCAGVMVNGRSESLGHELTSGDVVQVTTSRIAVGPSEEWLKFVRTPNACTHIRAYLAQRQTVEERGWEIFKKQLLHEAQESNLPLAEEHLRDYLEEAITKTRHYESVDRYLHAVASGVSPSHAITDILNMKLSSLVRDREGLPMFAQLHFAPCCHPQPGVDIVGRLKKQHGFDTKYSVHRATCPMISHLPKNILLTWAKFERRQQLKVTIYAQDYEGLTTDVLHVLNDAHVFIRSLAAKVLLSSQAHIEIVVEYSEDANTSRWLDALNTLPRVYSVREQSLEPTEPRLSIRDRIALGFMYSPQPVQTSHMFFGRESEISYIQYFLEDPLHRKTIMIVSGQRRVGKTSLLLHISRDPSVKKHLLPVFISFQSILDQRIDNIAIEIAKQIGRDVKEALGYLPKDLRMTEAMRSIFSENPRVALRDWVNAAHSALVSRKLLLLFDEMDTLIGHVIEGSTDQTIFDCLRMLGQDTNTAKQIIVINERTLRALTDVKNPALNQYTAESSALVRLDHLDFDSARRLIEVPFEPTVRYSEPAVRWIIDTTDRHPFLIHRLCDLLIFRMQEQDKRDRYEVTLDEVREAANELTTYDDGFIFHHLIEKRTLHELNILSALAPAEVSKDHARLPDQEPPWASTRALLDAWPARDDRTQAQKALRVLEDDHIVLKKDDRYRIRVPLFAYWCAYNLRV